MKSIKDRNAFITGAASGIGRALATALAVQGCHLYLVDVNEAGLRSLEQELASTRVRVWTRQCDLSDSKAIPAVVDAAMEASGGIDLLINNAGVMNTPQGVTEDGFELQFGVNHIGHFALTLGLLPALKAAKK